MQEDGWKTQDGRMMKKMLCKTWNAQFRDTFFHHSAALSFQAILLRKVPIVYDNLVTCLVDYHAGHHR